MPDEGAARVLIAGIGNVFLADDAFGVEVARRLARRPLPDHVRVLDVGLRSLYLAYELAEGAYDTVILVDAVSRGGAPGTLYVIEPDESRADGALVDAHGVRPHHVVATVRALGGAVGRMVLVGCEPACVDEGESLSAPVAAAVPDAERLVLRLATDVHPVAPC